MRERTKSLETLFRFRTALERMQWLRVQGAHTELEKMERALERLEQSRVEAKLESLDALRRGTRSGELELYSTAGLERAIAEHLYLKEQLTQVFETERKYYLERRRERETVESALKRAKAEIGKELERKEQMRIDDETLQRMSRGGSKSPFVI